MGRIKSPFFTSSIPEDKEREELGNTDAEDTEKENERREETSYFSSFHQYIKKRRNLGKPDKEDIEEENERLGRSKLSFMTSPIHKNRGRKGKLR